MTAKRRIFDDTFDEMGGNHIRDSDESDDEQENKESNVSGFLYVESKGKFLLSRRKWIRRFCSLDNGCLTISKSTVRLW